MTSIGYSAFRSCGSLTSITLPESLTSIGSYAFSYCHDFTTLDLSGCTNLTNIGSDAFYNCTGLTSITLPESLTSIGERTFEGCTHLEIIEYTGTPEQYFNISMGRAWVHFSYSLRLDIDVNGETEEVTSLVVPEGVTRIQSYAFYNCSSLISITLPESLKSIGVSAFQYCFRLTTVDLSGCTSLTSIANYAFSNCSGLTSIFLPSSLNSIGYGAFDSCSSLTSVEFADPAGWQVSTRSSFSGNLINIGEVILQDSSTACEFLTSTYLNYYWRKVEA